MFIIFSTFGIEKEQRQITSEQQKVTMLGMQANYIKKAVPYKRILMFSLMPFFAIIIMALKFDDHRKIILLFFLYQKLNVLSVKVLTNDSFFAKCDFE